MKIRPTSMILHTQPHKRWTEHDFLLLEAFNILEQERCRKCGHPKYICNNENSSVQFHVIEDHCYSSDYIASQEAIRYPAGKERPRGIELSAEAYMTDGSDLSALRGPYYIDRKARQDAIAASRLIVS